MDRRFRAACALALYTPQDDRWETVSGEVATALVIQNAIALRTWADALRPVGRYLLPPLASALRDEARTGSERSVIAVVYKTFAKDEPDALARLVAILPAPDKTEAPFNPEAPGQVPRTVSIALAKSQANVGVALVVMGKSERVWPLLKHTQDPTLRSFLIDRLAPGGVDPKVLISQFDREPDVSVKRAILLSLGEFGLDRLPPAARHGFLPKLVQMYQLDPDPGIHGAAEWLLRQWHAQPGLQESERESKTTGPAGKPQWYVNRQGQTMVVAPSRRFAIATKEVTVEQFLKFERDHWSDAEAFLRRSKHHQGDKVTPLSPDCPVNWVSWYRAAAYCNWLSKEEGIPEDQWCYERNPKGEYAAGMRVTENHQQRLGYRLPTEAEWEMACRAGAGTAFSFGEPNDLLGRYAWFRPNSVEKLHPPGVLKPNDLGIFDMHGNAWEWCQDRYAETANQGAAEITRAIVDEDHHLLRGGSFNSPASLLHCATRRHGEAEDCDDNISFRPARTLPVE
jgi:formylglycine-generating enzyme required for sulfatase activity